MVSEAILLAIVRLNVKTTKPFERLTPCSTSCSHMGSGAEQSGRGRPPGSAEQR